MALNLLYTFSTGFSMTFTTDFALFSRVCLILNEYLKSFIKTLQPEVQAKGGGGGTNVHLYTKELAILIHMHASLFLGKPIDVRYCFDCLPC